MTDDHALPTTVYGMTHDTADRRLAVRRCPGAPPRVAVGDHELDVETAKLVRDALAQFVRRATVRTDAGLPGKELGAAAAGT